MPGKFLQRDLAVFFNSRDFADVAVFRPLAGAARELRVLFDLPGEAFPIGSAGIVTDSIVCHGRVCDFAAEPARGDAIRIRSVDYIVEEARLDATGDLYRIELNKKA